MITYEYECKACEENFDTMQSIKDDAFTVCPACNTENLFRVFHPPIHTIVVGDPTTMGQLAERNAKTMSKEEMDKAQAQYKTAKTISRTPQELLPESLPASTLKDMPKWIEKNRTKTTKDVQKMTPEQTKKYIQEG
jgi:putative FmdB family regulatory protein